MTLFNTFAPAFLPYRHYWDDWIISDYCFLTAAEIELVTRFRNNPSIDAVANHFSRSAQTIRMNIKRIVRKLYAGKAVFDEWVIKYKAGTDQQDYPLHVPVTCLPVSTRLKTILYQVGNTLHEVFNTTQGDLKKLRHFGPGNQSELERFLQSCGINYNELIQTAYLKNNAA